MDGGLGELIALLRCAHTAAAPSSAMAFVRAGSTDVVRAFEEVVDPIIDRTILNPATRDRLHGALLFASVKGGFLISAYARMIGAPFRPDIAALAGSFTRLYDDLIDEVDDKSMDTRLADLFCGRPFGALTELELLLEGLYHETEARLARPRNDPIYDAVRALHEYQVLSREQKNPGIACESLVKITEGKGGLGVVVLFALVRPQMTIFERELIMQVGEMLQLLDDCFDASIDARSGITTRVTRGDVDLIEVSSRFRLLRPRIFAFYGRARGREFTSVLYLMLATAFLQRYGTAVPPAVSRRLGGAGAPLWMLLQRGNSACP